MERPRFLARRIGIAGAVCSCIAATTLWTRDARADEGDAPSKPATVIWADGTLTPLFGFGSGNLGFFFAEAGGEAHLWFGTLGLGLRGDAFTSGAPDGGSFSGWIAGADISARFPWQGRGRYLVLSAGAGWLSASGVPISEPSDGPKIQIGTPVLTGAVAQMFELGPLLLGFGVEVLGTPEHGIAFSPALHLGLAL